MICGVERWQVGNELAAGEMEGAAQMRGEMKEVCERRNEGKEAEKGEIIECILGEESASLHSFVSVFPSSAI